jgi:hypothetical protein
MIKIGTLNGFDVLQLNEIDTKGRLLFLYNNKRHTKEELIRMVPYDKNAKINFAK